MKIILRLILIVILAGCSYKPSDKLLLDFQDHNSEILTSLYKIEGDTIKILRVINKEDGQLIKIGRIWMGDFASINQQFDSNLSNNNTDSALTAYETQGFTELLSTEREVMFIQIVPDSSMSSIEGLGFLNYRQEIEGKLDQRLQQDNLGEWFAGDLGAGANMLFFIDNWNKAMKTVKFELKKEELLDHVLITKRLNTAPNDWIYEIVFPTEYEGIFNQM